MRRRIVQMWFGVAYCAVLVCASLLMAGRGPATQRSWVAWASTNLVNLAQHPAQSMLASAFLVEDDLAAWTVLAMAGLGALAWAVGAWRTLIVVAAAHLIGTAVSEGVLAWQIGTGVRPETLRYASDIGPSYIVVSALVAAMVVGPLMPRLIGLAGFAVLAPSLFGGLVDLDIEAVGHVCSTVVGAVAGIWLWRRQAARRSGVPSPPRNAAELG
jgi:hypothetical protein